MLKYLIVCWLLSGMLGPLCASTLKVSIKETPPFTLKDESGAWSGLSVDLWNAVAKKNQWKHEWSNRPLPELLESVKSGESDIGVAAISQTSQREKDMDFSHPYFSDRLAFVSRIKQHSYWSALEPFLSLAFLKAILALCFIIFCFGALLWLVERKKNADDFGGSVLGGLGSAFWWSAVTMTTVGYGDKTPKSLLGRVVGLIWMFTGLMVISGFMAAITSAVTVHHMSSKIHSIDDLRKSRVASLVGTSASEYLSRKDLAFTELRSLQEGLDKLLLKEIDAIVGDDAVLRYFVVKHRDVKELSVTHIPDSPIQQISFVLPSDSKIKELLNRSLLEILESSAWQKTKNRYIGEIK